MPVSNRKKKCIGRRKKRYSLHRPKVVLIIDNPQDDREVDTNPDIHNMDEAYDNTDQSAWTEAWANFYMGDVSTTTSPTSSNHTSLQPPDVTDSDGCSADLFYVVLHKVFQYSPAKDLDTLVTRLKSDRLQSLYLILCSDIQLSMPGFHGLMYVETDTRGIRLWQPYLHRHVMSSKYELTITPLLKPVLYAHGEIISDGHAFWTGLPTLITSLQDLRKLSLKLGSWDICVGNNEDCYVSMLQTGRTILENARKPTAAYREDVFAERDDNAYNSTVRAVKCSLLVRNQTRCSPCQLYRCTLRRKASREKNIKENSFDLKKTSHKNMSKETLIKKIAVIQREKKGIQDELNKLKKQAIATALPPIRGNVSKKRNGPMEVDNLPIAKRSRLIEH